MGILASGVLFFGGTLVLAVLLLGLLVEAPLPEWMFPVRGRWLRYLIWGMVVMALPVLGYALVLFGQAIARVAC